MPYTTSQQQPWQTWQQQQQPMTGVQQQPLQSMQQPLYQSSGMQQQQPMQQGFQQQQPLYQSGMQQQQQQPLRNIEQPLQGIQQSLQGIRQELNTGLGSGVGTGVSSGLGTGMGSSIQQQQQQPSYIGGQSMQQQPSFIGGQSTQQNVLPFNVLMQCPSDEDFAQDIENDPEFNRIIDQIIARIPPEACGVRPPRHRREERYVNSDCPPRTANIRRRLQSPQPDIIERHTIIRAPQDTINVVIEKPGMPPPCVYEKTDYEPESPPRIQHSVVCVQPSSRCPPGAEPDQGDDQLRQQTMWPQQQQQQQQPMYVPQQQQTQQTSRFFPVQQQQQSRFYPITSQFVPQTSTYMPQQQQQMMSQKYQVQPFYTTPYQRSGSQFMRQNYSSMYQPMMGQNMGYQQQMPIYPYLYQQQMPLQQQSTLNSQFTSAPISQQYSNIQPQQQQQQQMRSPFSNPELVSQMSPTSQYNQPLNLQQGQQQQGGSYYWPQTQPQQTMQGQDMSPKRGIVV
jgi:hypothetical protein